MTKKRPIRPASRGLDRRQFLIRGGALGGAALLGPSLLAACSSDSDGGSSGGGGGGGGNAMTFANWPAYIDEETVGLFKEATGVDLTYTEDYNDNNEYFAKIQPDLAAGRTIDASLIAPTYWMAARLIDLEWVDELPLDQIPNAANLVPELVDPSWDPQGTFSMPWQSGMTGIAYNFEKTGRELTSMEDLFDPEFKGKIGMLTEMRDTVGLVMLSTGEDPSEATFDSAQAAFERIEQAKADGQIRQFTGNDYMDDLAQGNFVACIGWSGDISQLALDDPNLRFVIPEEGGMQWSDTMVMPAGTENTEAVAEWINYVYDPVNAARITAYVGYNSPVQGVADELRKDPETAALADSPLLFPDEETLGRLKVFATLDEGTEAEFDQRFSEIIGA
ncbi:MAG: spermidine/putrescine ABC transporter substrate-binding protein [Acidimicrobiales bacterium]|nr:spermidine/putrescine ABC transporter substrate-binding protein [Acidimicrobiales bacterium]